MKVALSVKLFLSELLAMSHVRDTVQASMSMYVHVLHGNELLGYHMKRVQRLCSITV